MKKLLILTVLYIIASSVLFYRCGKSGDPNTACTDPQIQNSVNSANLWLLSPSTIGDNLTFAHYFKDKANGNKYIFRNDVSFTMSDTLTQKVKIKNIHRDLNCNEFSVNQNKVVNFKGPDLLKYQLEAGPITEFDIFLKDKKFSIGSDQYNYHQSGWYDSLKIGGREYHDVKLLYGFDPNDQNGASYIDSTVIFYDLKYGIIKSIIADTAIFIRKLP